MQPRNLMMIILSYLWLTFVGWTAAFSPGSLVPRKSMKLAASSPCKFHSPSTRARLALFSMGDDNDNDDYIDDDDNNDDNEEGMIFYDDFDDFSSSTTTPPFESSSPSSSSSSSSYSSPFDASNAQLQNLLQRTKQEDIQRTTRITENWNSGNWKCRGFALDKYDPLQTLETEMGAEAGPGPGPGPEELSTSKNELTSPSSIIDTNHPSTNDDPIHICQIAFDETALGPGFGESTEVIAVGRTDGSVYIVQLGSEYLTKFHAIPKVTMGDSWMNDGTVDNNDTDGDNDNDDDDDDDDSNTQNKATLRVESEMISDAELKERLSTNLDADLLKELEEFANVDESVSSSSSSSTKTTPFEILHQFQAHEKGEAITSLLFHDDTLYTAGTSGAMNIWRMDDVSDSIRMIPVQSVNHAHQGDVVVLKSLSSNSVNLNGVDVDVDVDVSDYNLVLSASSDGSFALWDRDGILVYRCELSEEDGNSASITAADVDTSSGEHVIYLGLSSGYVVGYVASDLVGHASESNGGTCPIPKCRFLAHDPLSQKLQQDNNGTQVQGITALTFGGRGRSTPSASTSIILTGGADGIIKQWEMIRQRSRNTASLEEEEQEKEDGPSDWSLQYWPRMPTQRMKDRAHIFKGHSEGPVTALVSNGEENPTILSAGADGTIRFWDSSKGELYRMDGFHHVSSLCLDREILVTDGMNEYVCIHDFDVPEDEFDDGYELEW